MSADIFRVVSMIYRYLFVIVIYLFIYMVLRLIYMDIKRSDFQKEDGRAYLKLINRRSSLPYRIQEHYSILSDMTFGRDRKNTVVLKDPYVSKRHCIIFLDDGEYVLRDENSSNGTYINGRQIEEDCILTDGDRVQIGLAEFLFVRVNQDEK